MWWFKESNWQVWFYFNNNNNNNKEKRKSILYLIEITISSNITPNENDDYPTIEADLNAIEVPTQKSLSLDGAISITPRQFGCSSFCYNQGRCVLVGQKITCRCASGFIGVRCQVSRKIWKQK